MGEHQPGKINPHQPGRYEIRLQGHLTQSRTSEFPGMTIHHVPDGNTILSGFVLDQSALHGLLNRIRDLNITLISVQYVGPDNDEANVSDDEKC